MSDMCPDMRPGCAATFARLEEQIKASGILRDHIEEERDRERDTMADSVERIEAAVGRVERVADRYSDRFDNIEKRLTDVEAAVQDNTTHRSNLTAWLSSFRTFGPYVWAAILTSGSALIVGTLWAVKHGFLTP